MQYKIIHLSDKNQDGSAAKIVIKDSYNSFTILNNFAATISTLNNGSILFYDNDDQLTLELPYQTGTLNVSNNNCIINILK